MTCICIYPLGEDTNNPNCLIISTVRLQAIGRVNPLSATKVEVALISSALIATISIPAVLKSPALAWIVFKEPNVLK